MLGSFYPIWSPLREQQHHLRHILVFSVIFSSNCTVHRILVVRKVSGTAIIYFWHHQVLECLRLRRNQVDPEFPSQWIYWLLSTQEIPYLFIQTSASLSVRSGTLTGRAGLFSSGSLDPSVWAKSSIASSNSLHVVRTWNNAETRHHVLRKLSWCCAMSNTGVLLDESKNWLKKETTSEIRNQRWFIKSWKKLSQAENECNQELIREKCQIWSFVCRVAISLII